MTRTSTPSLQLGLAAAAALWCAESCLSPGSLDHEEKFRVAIDAGTVLEGGKQQESGAAAPGCAAACDTFHTTCSVMGCHIADNPVVNLDLQSPGLVQRLSGAPAQSVPCFDQTLLVPGNPSKSLIYTKLIAKPACGLRMPLTGALSDPDIECIRRWVLAPSCDGDTTPDASAGGAAGSAGDGGMGNGGMGNGGAGGASNGGMGNGGRGGSGGMNTGGKGTGGKGTGGKASGGSPGDGGNPPPGSVLYLEAESGALAAPMVVSMDAGASGGKYISAPAATATKIDDPTLSTMGIATFTFNVMNAGTYTAFGRVEAPATASDSFWVKMDSGAWIQWNNITSSTTWVWDDVHDTGQADAVVTYMLAAGSHTLLIAYREPDTLLDKIALSSDPTFTPTGLGQ